MSPKGGNYCESTTSVNLAVGYANEFPSPTGVNHYELERENELLKKERNVQFPSPTGVNHYEYPIHLLNI